VGRFAQHSTAWPRWLRGSPLLNSSESNACSSHHRQMVDERVGRFAQHSTAWPRWLRGSPLLNSSESNACSSHHRQMVDERVGRFAQHSTAWPRWLRAEVVTGSGGYGEALYSIAANRTRAVATIAGWWMIEWDGLRSTPPRGRGGYGPRWLQGAVATGGAGWDWRRSRKGNSAFFLRSLDATLR
jgi:Fe-S cluster biosynthesis and repair protein YggX